MLTDSNLKNHAQPITERYDEVEIAMIENAASYFVQDKTLETDPDAWLSTMQDATGEVRAKNKSILNAASKEVKPQIESMMRGVFDSIMPIAELADDKINKRIMQASVRQAKSALNLTNTTALEGAQAGYLDAVNKAYLETVSGLKSYDQAIRDGVRRLADLGFRSASFRSDNGNLIYRQLDVSVREAVLTTASNMTRAIADNNVAQLGTDLIEVSSHVGARPKCAADQGKIYSVSGKHPKYPAFSTTSYGQPDGLFGINCHHTKYAFIEGVSERTFTHYDKETNDQLYKQSQMQRIMERDIRTQKRRVAAANACNDTKLMAEESKRLSGKQNRLDQFINETGRMRRTNREQVLGFDRSTAQKAVWANRANTGAVRQPKDLDVFGPGAFKRKPPQNVLIGTLRNVASREVYESIKAAENKIYKRNTERAVVVDRYGNIMVDKAGTHSEVQFTDQEVKAMKGGIMTHNHPSGLKGVNSTFSGNDMGMLFEADLKEMRLVNTFGTYRVQAGGAKINHVEIETAWNDLYNKSKSKYYDAIKSGNMSREDADSALTKQVTEAIVNKYGLSYSFERRK